MCKTGENHSECYLKKNSSPKRRGSKKVSGRSLASDWFKTSIDFFKNTALSGRRHHAVSFLPREGTINDKEYINALKTRDTNAQKKLKVKDFDSNKGSSKSDYVYTEQRSV